MIYKIADRNRVVHYNVIGCDCLVLLCDINRCARSVSPVSWRRMVDCMACLVRAASLPWCGHGPGQAIHVNPQFDEMVRRLCYRCSDTL